MLALIDWSSVATKHKWVEIPIDQNVPTLPPIEGAGRFAKGARRRSMPQRLSHSHAGVRRGHISAASSLASSREPERGAAVMDRRIEQWPCRRLAGP
jgi:hypothetical protein